MNGPFICIRGKKAGKIEWFMNPHLRNGLSYDKFTGSIQNQNVWQEYASFERNKLRELKDKANVTLFIDNGDSPGVEVYRYTGHRDVPFEFTVEEFDDASEEERLLKRYEFLKLICEAEGIGLSPEQAKDTLLEEVASRLEKIENRLDMLEHLS